MVGDFDIHPVKTRVALLAKMRFCSINKIGKDFKSHPYSSYSAIINNNAAFIDTKNVLDFFDGAEKFVSIHKDQVDYYYRNGWPSSKLE